MADKRSYAISIMPASALAFLFVWLPIASAPTQGLAAGPDLTTAIVEVAKRNIPAVAHIEVTERKEVANPFLPLQKDPFFRRFFGNRPLPKSFQQEVRGLGSGMIIDSKGHILTSYHVVEGATKIDVQLSNGSRYVGTVVGGDAKTDLAVIRIEAKETLPAVTFGDSDKLEVGEWVVAIGHPRGLDQTVTQGIVSAKHRRGIVDPTSYQDFLQTDAPINPGNSGGPLLNLKGEVVGVNAAIATESGGSEGIGFAVPSNIAVHISKTLIAYGKVERGWLGVAIQELTPDKAKSLGLKGTEGAMVMDVTKGGPAEKGGIRKDDIILSYQGKTIADPAMLQNLVSMTPIGSQVKITLLRSGKTLDITLRIGDLKDEEKVLLASAKERLGGDFRDATQKEAAILGLESPLGVVVTAVEPKGPLAQAGFEAGDIILQIDGAQVSNTSSLAKTIGALPAHRPISVLVADLKKKSAGTVKVTVR